MKWLLRGVHTLVQPGTRDCSSFILSLIFSLLTYRLTTKQSVNTTAN
jgi:hypothetical protein